MPVRLAHPLAGEEPLIASPMKFSGTPLCHEAAPPLLGQHTDEVLAGLGVSDAELADLRDLGVIGEVPDAARR
jgi:crotonobetainyl-CoA:carnitine CoA-transferase CaiB-like acyl-CoA transferase